MELELPVVPESGSTARHALRAFAQRLVADIDAVEVTVSEAVTNSPGAGLGLALIATFASELEVERLA
jgi:hypothetical protein